VLCHTIHLQHIERPTIWIPVVCFMRAG